jgi:hypothetical protein
MKTIDEIRRENLLVAIERQKTITALAELAGMSAAYLSQIKNRTPESKTGKPKGMGDAAARKIERAPGEAHGWMDAEHTDNPAPAYHNLGSHDPGKKRHRIRLTAEHEGEVGRNLPTEEDDLPQPTDKEYAFVPQLDIAAACGNGRFEDHVVVKGGLAFK